MKQLIANVFMALIVILAHPTTAQACRGVFPGSNKEAYGKATLVFHGKVLEVGEERHASARPSGGRSNYEARFQIRKWWKGGNEREVIIRFDNSTCGAHLKPGQEGIIFASGSPPFTSALSGNILDRNADKVTPSDREYSRRLAVFFKEFGEGQSP